MTNKNQNWLMAAMFIAAVLPWQIAFYAIPIVSFVTEAEAFAGWALFLLVLSRNFLPAERSKPGLAFVFALALLGTMATGQFLAGKIVWASQLVQLLYFLAVAALVAWSGAQLTNPALRTQLVDAWAWCWLLGCGLGVLAAVVQYAHLNVIWWLVAPLADEGRVYGNVHQPNHFATLMALGLPGIAWLRQRSKLPLWQAAACAAAVAAAVVLTSSRTGLLELLWIALWMVLPNTRSTKVAVPMVLGSVLAYGLFYALDKANLVAYFNGTRLSTTVQAMSVNDSRLQLWRETLALIAQNPWVGIGFGQLEFFRSFSDLPSAMKTIHINAHMVPLQIAVEYGLPVAALFFGLIVYAFVKAGAAWRDPVGNFALAGMGIVLIHSMTEFPLWYAFILLPFVFLCGLYLGTSASQASPPAPSPQRLATMRRMHMYAALAVLGGIVLSVTHYLPTIAMYVLNSKDITREDRLATANRAFLYKHWIVYNAIGGTSFEEISRHPELMALFDKSSRFYMNEFNMAQYALVLAENGRDAQANRVVYALRRLESPKLADLRTYCLSAGTAGAKRLLALIDNPAVPTVSAKDF